MITEARLHEIHVEMNRQLAERGTALDAIYFCPDAPAGIERTLIENSKRKPGPGMLLQAAQEIGLDLANSWMVGDLLSDVLAGLNAGCRSILVASGPTELSGLEAHSATGSYSTASDLATAVEMILDLQGTQQ